MTIHKQCKESYDIYSVCTQRLTIFLITLRDKLAPVKLNRYKDDLLFYMFYTNVGDVLQLAAAAEL